MEINRNQLQAAADKGLITAEQAERLWTFLGERHRDTPSFNFTHILYYLGGLIAIGAMTLFMTLGWEKFGGWGIFFISLAYAGAGLWLANYFIERRQLPIPGAIMATFVVALTPLAVYGLQNALGLWAGPHPYRDYHYYIDWNWVMMELATLAAGAVMLWRYRMTFLVMPVAVTLWYMSMDLASFLIGGDPAPDWYVHEWVSIWFGLIIILFAFLVDLRTRHSDKDYAFWLYLFGVMAFWGGLSLLDYKSELSKLLYCGLNLLMIVVGAVLSRRAFAIFGGLGVAGYLGHLSYRVFKDSLIFPVTLTVIGLGVIWLGVLWQKHEARLTSGLHALLPVEIRELLARRQQ
ncbi:MAG: DUF2157 domain-containing protein [Burkholderiales bacterium]